MGSSEIEYIDLGKNLFLDKDNLGEYVESLCADFFKLQIWVQELDQELKILKNKPHIKNQPPRKVANNCTNLKRADAESQTVNQQAMEIELQVSPPKRLVRYNTLKRKVFYTKIYTKKIMKREKMEVEKENKDRHTKSSQKIPTRRQEWIRIFVKKEVMEIEVKPNQREETPPKIEEKRAQAGKRHKETPEGWAPRAKRKKKNSPRKDLVGSIKNLIQPTRVTLMTDFFSVIGKSPPVEWVPDPKLSRCNDLTLK